MIKVGVVTAHFPSPERPTDGRSAYQTVRSLSLQTAVRVFCPSAAYPSVFKGKSASRRSCNTSFSPPKGVEVDYYDYPALPLVSRPFNGWIAAHALADHVRAFAPDLILSYFLYPDALAALQIGKALSIPVIAWGVGSDVHNIGDPISAMHTRSVLREADCLVMVSSDLRERAITMGAAPEKTLTILNGCDLSVFHVANRLDARTKLHIDLSSKAVVYIGRMDVKKGLRELVHSAAMLHPQIPDLQVYLVGEGPDKRALETLIRSNGATEYIHTMPECAFDEVAMWMTAADVVTLPSYMEGCPNVVLEALACGRPVVATNVGGIPEIMNNDYGRLVPPRDTPALARALASVLDRTWDAEAISAHCSRGWSDVASETLTIIESLVSTRKAVVHVP